MILKVLTAGVQCNILRGEGGVNLTILDGNMTIYLLAIGVTSPK